MTNEQKNNKEEEIDLGSLFVVIGSVFSKFFRFIGGIFSGIFQALISLLILIKQHFLKIVLAAVIGGVIGGFIETTKPDTYASILHVKPNFGSARQLYNNIKYYDDLVKQKDTIALAKIFNLDVPTAASIKKFYIEPVENQNNIINSYNSILKNIDTSAIKSFTFEDFQKNFTELDFSIHRIAVVSEKNNIFEGIDLTIISEVEKSDYFNFKKKLIDENLNRKDSIYRENLIQIDTLRNVYVKIMLEESKKQAGVGGTNIDLGGQKNSTKELDLFQTTKRINLDLEEISEQKAETNEIINIISKFQPIGYKIGGFTENYASVLSSLAALLVILFLLLKQFNNFLNNAIEKRKQK